MREIEGERLIMGRPFSRPTSTIEAYQPSINYVDINYETLRYARADLTGGTTSSVEESRGDVRAVVTGKGFV